MRVISIGTSAVAIAFFFYVSIINNSSSNNNAIHSVFLLVYTYNVNIMKIINCADLEARDFNGDSNPRCTDGTHVIIFLLHILSHGTIVFSIRPKHFNNIITLNFTGKPKKTIPVYSRNEIVVYEYYTI